MKILTKFNIVTIFNVLVTCILWLAGIGIASAQPVLAPEYFGNVTPLTASATGTTAATAATIPHLAADAQGKIYTAHICGFSIRANATAAVTGNATVAGVVTGTLNFTQWTAPLASGIGIVEPNLDECIRAASPTTDIVVTSAAPGSGGTVSVSAWGFYGP